MVVRQLHTAVPMKKTSLTVSLTAAAIAITAALPSLAEARIVRWGESGDVPITADFDGDGRSDITVWRPTTGEWWTIPSSTGAGFRKGVWGGVGDVAVPADYDGDGKADMAIFRAATHEWWIAFATGGMRVDRWGDPGDVAVPADYDGDGKADVAIWRPSTGVWWLAQTTKGIRTQQWGTSGDVPVTGQVDGYMGADFMVMRPSTRELFTLGSFSGATSSRRLPSFNETPVSAPFYCWSDTIGSFNRSNGQWTIPGTYTIMYGMAGDLPVPGLFSGATLGMGAQRAVFRPSEGKWYIHEGQEVCIN